MLVLSRHVNEKIVLDLRKWGLGVVDLMVVDIRGDKVRIGIHATTEVPVHRLEVFEEIARAEARENSTAPASTEGTTHVSITALPAVR